MDFFSKIYSEDDDGFEGNYEAYKVSTDKENLLNWLDNEVSNPQKLYQIIQELTDNILIIKNLNINEEYQGKGFGGEVLCDLLNESFSTAAILICDIGENQKEGFILEKFYENYDFKTISIYNNYPIMVFPSELANNIITKLKNDKKFLIKM